MQLSQKSGDSVKTAPVSRESYKEKATKKHKDFKNLFQILMKDINNNNKELGGRL